MTPESRGALSGGPARISALMSAARACTPSVSQASATWPNSSGEE
jgi:hypothetical protein